MKEKIFSIIKEKKNIIIGITLYVLFLFIVFTNLYTALVSDIECGIKSKLCFIGVFGFVSICGAIFIYIVNKKKIKPEYVFLIIASILGVVYLFVTPLFKGHDEQYHWYKSYAVSTGQFRSSENNGVIGDYLPTMANEIFNRQGFFTQINYKSSAESWKYSIENKENKETEFVYNEPTAPYSPLQMMPQALGIAISRLFNADIYTQAMCGRLANLVFYIILGFFSIKVLPKGKYFLVAFLLSPKIMYLSATLSGDIFTNSIVIFYFSYILKLKSETKLISKKQMVLLTILAPCVAICKTIYLPVCFTVIMLQKNSFKTNKRRIGFFIFIITLSIISSLTWIKLSNSITFDSELDTLPSQQMKFVKEHLFLFLGVMIRGVCNNCLTWTEDIVGGYMEWGSALVEPQIISVIIFAIFILAILVDKTDNNKLEFKIWEKIMLLIISLIVIAGAMVAMYINWTPLFDGVGGLKIIGVQGRYFVPIVLLLAQIAPCKILNIDEKFKVKWIYIFMFLCNIFAIGNILIRNI